MSYVLTVIHPPVPPAAFGKAVVLDPVAHLAAVYSRVVYVLISEGRAPTAESEDFASSLIHAGPGIRVKHESTGFAFRIDPADDAPHPCPCCGRLVLPSDHLYAYADDALCLGCFPWSDGVGCLPANTAHTEEP